MSSSATLPNEVLTNILGYLNSRCLASVSLVSKLWQVLVFARLYHTVYLAVPSHLRLLAKRVSEEENDKIQLSVSNSVRKLVINEEHNKFCGENYIHEENLGDLSTILPKLSRLERFVWDLSFVPRDPAVIELLQTQCPSLTSVHFEVKERPDTLELYDDSFVQFFIDCPLPPEFDEEHTAPFALLLRACPTLRSLTLNLEDDSASGFEWSPSALLSALDDDSSSEAYTLPSLHTFRALGEETPNWDEFFESPESNALHRFFKRHPGLHTIGFGWIRESGHYQDIDPNEIVALFPSLKHLEAASFLRGPIISSELADQLESLVITDRMYEGGGPNLETVAQAARSLPKLKRIVLHAEQQDNIEVETFKGLLRATPALEELEFRLPLDEPEQLIPLLRLVPNLRTLSVLPVALDGVKSNLGVSEWQDCIPALVGTCPLLAHFNDLNVVGAKKHWDVAYAQDGKVSVVQAFY
ncbi:hypothetical protein BDV93DRAFT_547913 [Ceratobasidium sp. AG-I]|nr:hypothetical protein BDV93DRAFT_547913 [Ceratobasidium sp. AG-I]